MKQLIGLGWTAVAALYAVLAIELQSWGMLGACVAFLCLAYAWHRWAE